MTESEAIDVASEDAIRELLRGELAAVETYERALEQLSGDPLATPVQAIHAEHVRAVYLLRERLAIYTDEPVTSSGAWGTFATVVESAANLLGHGPALRVLQEGEQHGIRRYEDTLEQATVDAKTQLLIREQLLPSCRDHGEALARLRNGG
ncbi:MAG: DUF2383 domain-containing protein [Deltaproteobacteria bacterium]|nr:DUF2383 domain-containing protein [Nannocystaceae bacterium]